MGIPQPPVDPPNKYGDLVLYGYLEQAPEHTVELAIIGDAVGLTFESYTTSPWQLLKMPLRSDRTSPSTRKINGMQFFYEISEEYANVQMVDFIKPIVTVSLANSKTNTNV